MVPGGAGTGMAVRSCSVSAMQREHLYKGGWDSAASQGHSQKGTKGTHLLSQGPEYVKKFLGKVCPVPPPPPPSNWREFMFKDE